VIVDSQRKLAGSLIDHDRAALVLDILESADVPIIVIHHPRAGSNNGPAGAAAWGQAYRQLWIITRHTWVRQDLQELSLTGSGNDDGGAPSYVTVQVDFDALTSKEVDAASATQVAAPTAALLAPVDSIDLLARLAFEFGVPPDDRTAGKHATAVLGAPRDKKPNTKRQQRVAAVFGLKTIGHQALTNKIRTNRTQYEATLRQLWAAGEQSDSEGIAD
jgi:hypothetical protein